MERSSIHVSAATRQRLALYKAEAMSYDELLNIIMDGLDPAEFKSRWRARRREAAKRSVQDVEPEDVGARMEKAFRLFELGRGMA